MCDEVEWAQCVQNAEEEEMLMRAGVHVKQRVNADAAYIGGSSEHANGAPAELVPDWVVGSLGCRQTAAKRREAGDFTAPALQALDQTQRCHVVNACNTM